MTKFIKFALVGIVNTLVDLGILNILLLIVNAGVNGKAFVVSKAISFLCAVIVSYALNRRFVFLAGEATGSKLVYERSSFLLVSLLGLMVNTLTGTLAFTGLHALFPDAPAGILATIGGLVGTACVLFFNYFGYKNFVFRHTAKA